MEFTEIVCKIWLTLAVLFLIALGVYQSSEDGSFLSYAAMCEMVTFVMMAFGTGVVMIWTK